jgi:hypothetical protein
MNFQIFHNFFSRKLHETSKKISLFVLLSFFFWPLWCLLFFDLRTLITPLVSVVWPSSIYEFWLPLWYLLSDLLRFTDQTTDIKVVIRVRISKKVRQQKPRGNQSHYIEEGHTTQWPKEKVQKDKQWSYFVLFTAFWRLVLCLSIAYELILVWLLFQVSDSICP